MRPIKAAVNIVSFALVLLALALLAACSNATPTPTTTPPIKIGMVIDSGGENDRSFNQYSLEGARSAADAAALDFSYVTAQTTSDYERHIETLIEGDADFIITNGFRMGVATANAARRYPDVHFVTTDTAFFPGAGCPETVTDCYDEEGGLVNVTSLVFAEDEVGYLAGVLAACMSETGIIASIAGVELPPVVRFVVGYQTGAQTHNADITTLNQYIPDFNDPSTGNVVAQDFINQGADVIFGVGGNTGNGGLLAAHEAGLMAIGVDVDQYFSYPEIQSALLSSAAKNIDRATAAVVEDFAAGELNAGIRIANLSNGGVGLAPFHDWEDQIPQDCLDAVEEAENAIIADPTVTGAKDE